MRRVELLLAECYANACAAGEIARGLGVGARIRHDAKMGRDKVLKKIESLRERLSEGSSIVAVIDYEEGSMREFVARNFEFKEVLFDGAVHVGVYKRDGRVLAVVFDPHIEGFLCRTTGRFCGEGERRTIKRGGMVRVCEEISPTCVDILRQISRAIGNLLGSST